MNKDEALDLALDWLVCYKDKSMSRNNAEELAEELITAIKQARSAPVQEPHKELSEHMMQATNGRVRIDPVTGNAGIGNPPAAQRQWVGLTDEDKLHIEIMGGKSDVMLAEMVETKLKELNT
jgi:hypothetical protein